MKHKVECKKLKSVAMGLSLMALGACGEYSREAVTTRAQRPSQVVTGVMNFEADLSALNATVAASANGEAKLVKQDSKLQIDVQTSGLSETEHRQSIRAGRCPTISDDTNSDGIIDAVEAENAYGDVIVALTEEQASDEVVVDEAPATETPSTDVPGTETPSIEAVLEESSYPLADASGSYMFSKTIEESLLENLDTSNYVIVVHGVEADAVLADSVATTGSDSKQETLPVACGKFERQGQDDGQIPDQDQGQNQSQDQQQQQQQQRQQQQQNNHQQQSSDIPEINEADEINGTEIETIEE